MATGLAGFVLSQLHMDAMVVSKSIFLDKIQILLFIVFDLTPKTSLYEYYCVHLLLS